MRDPLNRRAFLKGALSAGLPLVLSGMIGSGRLIAAGPFARPGRPRFRLSLAAYSFRNHFNNTDPGRRFSLFDFIDYCADQGCDGAEVTSYYFPAPVTRDYLLKLKRHAFLRGVGLSGTAVGNNFVHPPGPARDEQVVLVKQWVDHAALLGAPHIRVFAGPAGKHDVAEARKWCVGALEECCDYAGRSGIMLGLENHGGIVAEAEDLLGIVRAVNSPWLGINLDTGNFHTDDPYGDLARCAPHAVNVQVKVELSRRNGPKERSDFPRLIRILRDAGYQGYVALEHEADEDPFATIPAYLKELKSLLAE